MHAKRLMTGLLFGLALGAMTMRAGAWNTYHVATNGVDEAARDGLSWDTAFASPHYAVKRAAGGDTILVSNGVYHADGQHDWDYHLLLPQGKHLTIKGVNQASEIILDGGGGDFFAIGGWEPVTIHISNITITNFGRDAVYATQADGSYTLNSLVIAGNRRGIYHAGGLLAVNDCVIKGNTTGGGIYTSVSGGLTVRNSRIAGNHTTGHGGGIRMGSGNLVENSIISGNTAAGTGAGVNIGSGTLKNCLIVNNTADGQSGGVYSLSTNTFVHNCTIMFNKGSRAGGIREGTVYNSIVYGNEATGGGFWHVTANYYSYFESGPDGMWIHSITSPDPAFYDKGINCIVADPELDADFKPLRGVSPAINAGLNQAWMEDATDLAGNRRIFMGTVDIGAYEYVPPGTLIIIR